MAEGRIPSLDGLRALAITFVLLGHGANLPAVRDTWIAYPLRKAFSGTVGVQVFFVISGFLITHYLIKELRGTGRVNLRRFYARRALRLLPASLAFLLVLFCIGYWGISEEIANIEFIGALFFFRNHVSDGKWFTGHFWSLSVEEQFYFCWPVVLLGSRAPARLAILAVVGAPMLRYLVAWNEVAGGREWLVTNMDGLAVGCLVALFRERVMDRERKLGDSARSVFRMCALLLLPTVSALPGRLSGLVGPLQSSVVSIASAFLIVSLSSTERGMSYRVFNCAPVVRVGIASYSIYLWQQMFLTPRPFLPLPGALPFLVALGCGWLSWRLLEVPFVGLRKKLEGGKAGTRALG